MLDMAKHHVALIETQALHEQMHACTAVYCKIRSLMQILVRMSRKQKMSGISSLVMRTTRMTQTLIWMHCWRMLTNWLGGQHLVAGNVPKQARGAM